MRATVLACVLWWSFACSAQVPLEGFVVANGVQLEYLDWQGSGPALILVHGLADNPHVFADLAPAFTARFRVIAYARRGSDNSEVRGPYDVATLTADLRGLMDALGIRKAILAGLSAGGEEITRLAIEHPDRVERIVYLESGYDFGGDFRTVVNARPFSAFDRPAHATGSFQAYRSFVQQTSYPTIDDMQRLEANLRARTLIQPDGSVRDRTPKELVDVLYAAMWGNPPRQYAQVRCPVLAIYAEHYYDLSTPDIERRTRAVQYERTQWEPFRQRSISRLQRELPDAQVVHVPGGHSSFIFMSRQQIIEAMRGFFRRPGSTAAGGPPRER